MLLDKLNDRLHEDIDGVDYLCIQLDRIQNLVERASGLYDILLEIVDILRSAQDSLRSLVTGKSLGYLILQVVVEDRLFIFPKICCNYT